LLLPARAVRAVHLHRLPPSEQTADNPAFGPGCVGWAPTPDEAAQKGLLIIGQETLEERQDKTQPRAWLLEKDNGRRYAFTPHNGLYSLDF
jgi:hypothetical protein